MRHVALIAATLVLSVLCLAPTLARADEPTVPEGPPPGGAPPEAPLPLPEADADLPTAPPVEPPTGRPPADEPREVRRSSRVRPGRLPNTHGPALPSTIGMTHAEARGLLDGWGVLVERTIGGKDLVGKVVAQVPQPGDTLARGERVTLVLAVDGKPSDEHQSVPDVQGNSVPDAARAIRDAGFSPVVYLVQEAPAPAKTVLLQQPLPGSLGRKGAEVRMLVARMTAAAPLESGAPDGPMPPPPAGELGAPPAAIVPMPPPPLDPGPAAVPPTPMEPPPMPAPGAAEPRTRPTHPAPSAPRLLGPERGLAAPRAFGSTFRWTAVPAATEYEWVLEVEAKDGTWSTKDSTKVEGTRYRPKRMEEGRYRWRIRALRDGVEGEWSPYRRLYLY